MALQLPIGAARVALGAAVTRVRSRCGGRHALSRGAAVAGHGMSLGAGCLSTDAAVVTLGPALGGRRAGTGRTGAVLRLCRGGATARTPGARVLRHGARLGARASAGGGTAGAPAPVSGGGTRDGGNGAGLRLRPVFGSARAIGARVLRPGTQPHARASARIGIAGAPVSVNGSGTRDVGNGAAPTVRPGRCLARAVVTVIVRHGSRLGARASARVGIAGTPAPVAGGGAGDGRRAAAPRLRRGGRRARTPGARVLRHGARLGARASARVGIAGAPGAVAGGSTGGGRCQRTRLRLGVGGRHALPGGTAIRGARHRPRLRARRRADIAAAATRAPRPVAGRRAAGVGGCSRARLRLRAGARSAARPGSAGGGCHRPRLRPRRVAEVTEASAAFPGPGARAARGAPRAARARLRLARVRARTRRTAGAGIRRHRARLAPRLIARVTKPTAAPPCSRRGGSARGPHGLVAPTARGDARVALLACHARVGGPRPVVRPSYPAPAQALARRIAHLSRATEGSPHLHRVRAGPVGVRSRCVMARARGGRAGWHSRARSRPVARVVEGPRVAIITRGTRRLRSIAARPTAARARRLVALAWRSGAAHRRARAPSGASARFPYRARIPVITPGPCCLVLIGACSAAARPSRHVALPRRAVAAGGTARVHPRAASVSEAVCTPVECVG